MGGSQTRLTYMTILTLWWVTWLTYEYALRAMHPKRPTACVFSTIIWAPLICPVELIFQALGQPTPQWRDEQN